MKGFVRVLKMEPYRLHFFCGTIAALIGAGTWVLFFIQKRIDFPGPLHSMLMIFGFLMSFVTGFLMTAIPKMTGTRPASALENSLSLVALFGFLLTSLMGHLDAGWGLAALQFVLLIQFLGLRMSKIGFRTQKGFLFIPLGIFCGFLGILMWWFSSPENFALRELAKRLIYEGFLLNLIVGLGSRLIPILTKKSPAGVPTQVAPVDNRIIWIEATLLNASFFIEVFAHSSLGILMRGIALTLVLFNNFQFHKQPFESSKLGSSMGFSIVIFPLTYFLILFFPNQRMNLIHLLFIGGFALLTFLISIRVTVAHAGESLEFERTSRHVVLIFLGIFLAALSRSLLPALDSRYSKLGILGGAGLFLLGCLYWLIILGPKLKRGAHEEDKC